MKTITCRILTITISIILLIQLIGCQKSAVDTSGIDRLNHGIAYLEQGEYKNAITELEAALRADPTNFEALKNLAGAYAFDGDWTTARDKYIEAREMRPNDPSNYVNLATVFMNLQEFSLAWDNIEIARNTDPSYPLLHYVAGELFRIQGYEDDAVAAFTEYISLEPNTRPAGDAREIIELLRPGQYEDEEDTDDETAEVEDEETAEPEPEIIDEEPEEIPDDEIEEDSEENDDVEIDEEVDEVTDDVEIDEEVEEVTDEEIDDEVEEVTDDEIDDEVEEVTDDEIDEEVEEVTDDEENGDDEEETDDSEDEILIPDLPELTGDELYTDRLSRGRRMRAIGSTQAAIMLLMVAYEVHPDFAIVNYELGMAYLADGQIENARYYLERYIGFETDETLIAEVQARLNALDVNETPEIDEDEEPEDEESETDEEEDVVEEEEEEEEGFTFF